MPPLGTRTTATTQAVVRLGSIVSKTFTPTTEAKDDCLNATIAWYDQIRPLRKIHQSAGDGSSRRFVLATLIGASWAVGDSQVESVAVVSSPDTSNEVSTDVPVDQWQQDKAINSVDILMLGASVDAGSTLRIRWSAPHTVHATDASLTTIPTKDADAFLSMFAAYLARWISRRASDDASASIGADQIDAEPIGERWARRAKELEKMANERISAPPADSLSPAGTSIDWDVQSTLGRQGRIGH